jgi:hypothetical protein
MASIERLREAAATGSYYEALMSFKTVLNRKINLKKDRDACVSMIVDGITALIDGSAKGQGASPTEALARVMPAVTDIAGQLLEVFSGFKAPYDGIAVDNVRSVALAIYPTLDTAMVDSDLARGEVPFVTAMKARAVATFADKAVRWSRERTTTRGEFGPLDGDHRASGLHWVRGVALVVAATHGAETASANDDDADALEAKESGSAASAADAVKAVQHLLNVVALPPAMTERNVTPADVLALAVVLWCGKRHVATSLPWFTLRVALLILCQKHLDLSAATAKVKAFVPATVSAAVKFMPAESRADLSNTLTLSPQLHFLRLLVATLEAKSADAADAVVAYYRPLLDSGDKKLVAIAEQAQATHKCTSKATASGAGGILGALLGGFA